MCFYCTIINVKPEICLENVGLEWSQLLMCYHLFILKNLHNLSRLSLRYRSYYALFKKKLIVLLKTQTIEQ